MLIVELWRLLKRWLVWLRLMVALVLVIYWVVLRDSLGLRVRELIVRLRRYRRRRGGMLGIRISLELRRRIVVGVVGWVVVTRVVGVVGIHVGSEGSSVPSCLFFFNL